MNDPEKANAFILANEGYDVWLGNNRGSRFSLGHKTLSNKDRDYWEYWQADLGLKDTKAWIDFILEKTGLESLSYVGHSQGTTQMFLAGSLDPAYFKQKVNLFVALAPVGTTASISNPLLKFASDHINLFIDTIVEDNKLYNWFPNFEEGTEAIDLVCTLA